MEKNTYPQPPHRGEPNPFSEPVPMSEIGYVPAEHKHEILHEPTADEKLAILKRVGDNYSNDGPVRKHRGTEPCDFDAYENGRQPGDE